MSTIDKIIPVSIALKIKYHSSVPRVLFCRACSFQTEERCNFGLYPSAFTEKGILHRHISSVLEGEKPLSVNHPYEDPLSIIENELEFQCDKCGNFAYKDTLAMYMKNEGLKKEIEITHLVITCILSSTNEGKLYHSIHI